MKKAMKAYILNLASILKLLRTVLRTASLNLKPNEETSNDSNNDGNNDNNPNNDSYHIVLGLRLTLERTFLNKNITLINTSGSKILQLGVIVL